MAHSRTGRVRASRPRAVLTEALEPRLLLAGDVKFAVLGDFSADVLGQPTPDVANLIKSWNPAFVVTVGDNNYPNGAASTIDTNIGQFYHQFIYPYTGKYGAGSGDAQNHFYPALGNHDWNTSGATPYLNYFTLPGNERYYDVQQGNVGIFVVDSDPHEVDGNTSGSTQGKWLQSELAKSTAQFKFVFFHHPAYSSGGIGSNPYMQWPFQQWGATAVFAGHDHDYERLTENGIPYFVDGLGGESIVGFGSTVSGSQVRYAGDYGAMLVDASSTSVTFQFITRTGQVIDTYTIGVQAVPAAPSGLTATAGAGQINLVWKSNSTNATGIKIERSSDGISFAQVATAGGAATSFSDSSLPSNATYFYRVRANNSSGDSTASNVASATTLNAVPLIAAGAVWKYLDNGTNAGTAWRATAFSDTAWKSGAAQLGYGDGDEATVVSYGPSASKKYITTYFRRSVTISNPATITSLNLNLLRDDGAVVYLNGSEIFRSNMPTGTISYTTLASTNIDGAAESAWNSAVVNPALLSAGTNVIAVEIHQSVADSSDISFDFQLTGASSSPLPAAPTNLVANAVAASQVVLSWTDNASNESGFKVERSTDGITFAPLATTAANIASYSDTSASGGLTYYYRVRATNASGDSSNSNIAVAPPLTPPAAPTNLSASGILSTRVNLTWVRNSSNEAGFEVNRSTDGVNWILLIIAEDGTTAYSDTAVSPGATYSYRVRAVNPAGNSSWTNTVVVSVPSPNQIVYLSDLNWVSATNGWGQVEKDMSVGGPNAVDGRTLMLNGITYSKGLGVNSVSQIVYSLAGAYSTFQCDVGVDDEETLNGTVNFQVLVDGVLLYDSGKMTATTTTASVNLNVTGAQQLTLICGDAGDGPDYDHGDWAGARLTLSATPVPPAAPSNLSATAASSSQINVRWAINSTNQTGFRIERSPDSTTFTQVGLVGANVTAYSDSTGLLAGTQYFYRVEATNTAGDSASSNIASATTLAATAITTYLSDLPWVSATAGWGTVQKDLNIKSAPLMLRGVVYPKGLGTHAASQIVYNLGGQYSNFLSDIGIDDEVNGQGSVDFQVLGDGVVLFDSGVIAGTSPVIHVNIPVTGVQLLTLIANNAIPGDIDYDHADWAGARVVSTPTQQAALTASVARATTSKASSVVPITKAPASASPFNSSTLIVVASKKSLNLASQLATDRTGRPK